ncbi:anti-sigma factor [Burkholderia plantarii]|uniref:anti-sigma factor n=1 Tax=Burkholderia plantarii TaxID=41899 RepID=UPI0018DBB802|nr:anti-sigma factor [Burkholderia plantarii]MBI0325735.1 anti-sigma factor [Burkholderia plantarii]
MKPDDIQLLAYVNGELPARERDTIEQAMRRLPEVAGQVALLRASDLPYREAFAAQQLPPLPAGLVRGIERLAQRHAARMPRVTAAAGANDPAIDLFVDPGINPAAAPSGTTRRRVAPGWLAAAFVAGALIWGGITRLAPGAFAGFTDSSSAVGLPAEAPAPRGWIAAAAGYQQLYSHDTLASVAVDPQLTASTLGEIRRLDGLALTIPDLRAAGLAFKRVQRLRFQDRPLAQIVYLPEHGAPVALCVMRENQPDEATAERTVEHMDVVTWRSAGLRHALIGRPGDADLTLLARRIADADGKPLFSSLGAAPAARESANPGTNGTAPTAG